MNTGWKIHGWRQQKAANDDKQLPVRKNFNKQTIQNNMPEKNDEIKKQAVDIIIAPAENIKKGNQFNHDIVFEVVPERIVGTE